MYIFILIKKNENSDYKKIVNNTVIEKKKKNYFCMLGIVMIFTFFFTLSVHLIWSYSPRNKPLELFSRETLHYAIFLSVEGFG